MKKEYRLILISACLLGVRCRFDGTSCIDQGLVESEQRLNYLPICPEQLGGMPTPRDPVTIVGGDGTDVLDKNAKIIDSSGKDVTDLFLLGVEAVLQMGSITGIEKAVLKENSPSCGVHRTNIDNNRQPGIGVLAAALSRAGVPLYTEDDYEL